MHKPTALLCTVLIGLFSSCTTPTDPAAEIAKLNAVTEKLSPSRADATGPAADSMSTRSFMKELEETRALRAELNKIDTSALQGDDLIDWKFARSILAGREIEQGGILPWKRDPRLYMTFTGLSTVMESPASAAEKAAKIEQALRLAVIQMANGRNQLETYVPRFQELGLFMAENSRVLLGEELPAYIMANSLQQLEPLVREAGAELERYITFLRDELPKKPAGDFAIGPDLYNALLKEQYLLGYDADSLYAFGWAQFNATVKELEQLAATMKPGSTWQELAREIKNEYPEPHSMIEVHQEWVNKTRDHVLQHNLIPIPWKERVKVVARAPYLRKTSYYGHFSFARKKDADSIYTSEMHINPFEDQWDEKKKMEYLVEHDWGVIMVTAPHETYAGHHIQGLYQVNNPRKLRRENSISIFSEGWGLYNEQLFRETGFFPNDKIRLRQLQLRLWRNARVIYDVGMHTGKMSYDDAVKLMTEGVGFLQWASQLEIDASSASPGYFIGYFTGMMEILRMREDYRRLKGEQFTLSGFHEKLLKAGSMPIVLMREALFLNEPNN